MNDLIRRQAAIEECNKDYPHGYMYAYCLKQLPIIDAVEVVRCKNCKHWDTRYDRNMAYYGLCQLRSQPVITKPTDYCSYGLLEMEVKR